MPNNITKNLAVGNQAPGVRTGTDQPNPEQANYDIFVSQGIKLAAAAADKMQGKASVDALGNVLFEIVTKIENEGKKNGVNFSLPVILHGSAEILGHIIELSEVDINEEQAKAAMGIATGRYIENALKTGKWTPEQAQQFAQEAQAAMPQQPQGEPVAGPAQPATSGGPVQPGPGAGGIL